MTGAPIDLLYRLTTRDQAFPHWGPNFGDVLTTATATSLKSSRDEWDANLSLPQGTTLFITNLMLFANPGGSSSVGLIDLALINRETSNRVTTLLTSDDALVGNIKVLQSHMDIAILLDRFYIEANSAYSGAPALHLMGFSWAGYVVPVGEVGFV